jgi:hypothetical protein
MTEKKLNVNNQQSSLSKSLGMSLGIGLNLNLMNQTSQNSPHPTSTGQ